MPSRRVTPSAILAIVSGIVAVTLIAASSASAAQAPVGLGAADAFAVLAGSGITNTGPTTITGDVGTFPTPSESGFGSITMHGANHRGDAVTQDAKDDLVTAYLNAAGRKPVHNLRVELGGRTLHPGVYASPTFGLTGTLTLDARGDANAQFVFQAESTLITASSSNVRLINGAQACNVVWQVGSSATFGTGARFVGDVLAYTSITATTGATFHGRLLARNGAVTLDTNTITRAVCTAGSSGSATTRPSPTATKPAASGVPASPTPITAKARIPGDTVSRTPATPPGLPFTGMPTGLLIGTASALLVLGGLTVRVTRRRSDGARS
jgi:hypothetical protein